MTVLRMELAVAGPDLDAETLFALADRARNAKPAMQSILGQLVIEEKRLYDTAGSSGGESWPEDRPSTIAKKTRQHQDVRPERATGALEKSLTVRNSGKNRIRQASKQQLRFGTRLFYARFQTERPLMQFTAEDQQSWEGVLARWLMEGTVEA